MRTSQGLCLLAALWVMATGSGCGSGDPDPTHESGPRAMQPANPAPSANRDEEWVGTDFKLALITGSAPNDYQVRVKWNNSPGYAGGYQVKRTEANSTVTAFAVKGSQSEYIDANLPKKGLAYTYQVHRLAGDGVDLIGSGKIYVPADLEIKNSEGADSVSIDALSSETLPLRSKRLQFNRIFMAEGTLLRTGYAEFQLKAKELVIAGERGATIENLQSGATAAEGAPGRPGGEIKIEIDRLRGTLAVVTRGENGGKGLTGAAGASGTKGARGADTIWKGGDAERGLLNTCIFPGKDGAPGSNGADGKEGELGYEGGAAASVRVTIEHALGDADLRIEKHPGLGGAPGEGGPGGKGGDGGDPGSNDPGWPRHQMYIPVPLSISSDCWLGANPFRAELKYTNPAPGNGPPLPYYAQVLDLAAAHRIPAPRAGARGADGKPGARGALYGKEGKTQPACIVFAGTRSECRHE